MAALFSGADAIGFVFYKRSPRYINPAKAGNISRILPKKLLKAGVFVNAKEKDIKKIYRLCDLDMLQFHGEESPEFCARFKKYKVIKAFKIKKGVDSGKFKEYKTFAYLFDAFCKDKPGGTGRKFNWNLLKKADKIKRPVFLSGGLNSRNVRSALKAIRPDWVDASSGVEASPGKKDHRKVSEFIKRVK